MTTVTREHLAGLELALESGAVTSSDMRESVRKMIAQAKAAPEQESVTGKGLYDLHGRACCLTQDPYEVVTHEHAGWEALAKLHNQSSAEIERLRAELAESEESVLRVTRERDGARVRADSHRRTIDGMNEAHAKVVQKLADAQALLRAYDQPIRVAIKMLERTLSPTAMEIALELKRCLGDSCDFLSATAQPAEVKS